MARAPHAKFELRVSEYGPGNWNEGTGSEFNKIRKWGDRSFQDP